MVKFARCNAMLSLALDESGNPCRYMSKGDTEQDVLDDISKHLKGVHNVEPSDMVNNIRASIRTTRT